MDFDGKRQGLEKKVTSLSHPSVGGRAYNKPSVAEDPVLRAITEMRSEFNDQLSKISAKCEAQAKEIRDLKGRVMGQAPKPPKAPLSAWTRRTMG